MVLRLSDHRTLDRLERRAEELWPALPDQVPAYEEWLGQATALIDRLPGHEEFLAELLDESGSWAALLGEEERDWWIEALQSLIRRTTALQGTGAGTISDLTARLHSAQTVHQRSIEDHEEFWDEAITEIALSERYGGLEIEPQIGLVPLGRDEQSGLWEFWHVATGAMPVRRDLTGRLEISGESGIVLVLLPGGTFWMGSQSGDPDGPNYDPAARKDEGPPHEVSLVPFFLSKFEITQGSGCESRGPIQVLS